MNFLDKHFLAAIFVAASVLSCGKQESAVPLGAVVSFSAEILQPDTPDSKVAMDNTGKTTWVAGDKIQIYYDGGSVTAKAGSKSGTCEVAVILPKVDVSGVTLNKTSIELTEGETLTLVATVTPDNATDKSVTWTSSATSVASVADGVVKGLSAGTAVITVRTNDGGYEATCEVTVKAAKDAVGGTTDDWNIEDELSDQDLL